MSYYRDQLEKFLKTLDVKADFVLDVGGKQKSAEGRTKTWTVKKYACIDLPEYNLDIPFKYPEKADIIFCLEVFEYLIVPTVALKNIYDLLKPNGKAYISFPLVYPVHNEVEFDSLRYTLSGIKRLAKHADLKIQAVTHRNTKTNTLVKYYNEDGMKAAKGLDHNITGYIVEFKK